METIKFQRRRVWNRTSKIGFTGKIPKEFDDSVDKVLRPVFILARCIAIPYFERKFKLLDWRTVLTCTLGASNAFLAILCIIKVFNKDGLTFPNVGQISFYMLTLVYFFLFLRMSSNWPSLRDEWRQMEAYMTGLPAVKPYTFISAVTVLYTLLAFSEHILSIIKIMKTEEDEKEDILTKFLISSYDFSEMSTWRNLSAWKVMSLRLANGIIAIIWNFPDIFIITVSIALSARLKQLHLSLETVMCQDMTVDFWRLSRQRYNKISTLIKHINQELSLLLLLTFSNNFYSICLMLLRTLKSGATTVQYVYYISSFTLVLLRVFGVCIAAARINEISKGLLPIMFSVSSSSYNTEVHRLILEVKDDDLALNCWKFFKVTRNLFLNVAGTIVTYEVVLVQLEGSNTDK